MNREADSEDAYRFPDSELTDFQEVEMNENLPQIVGEIEAEWDSIDSADSTRSGRSPTGGLRNFKQMSTLKFRRVAEAVFAENNDPEAIIAVSQESTRRRMTSKPPPFPKSTPSKPLYAAMTMRDKMMLEEAANAYKGVIVTLVGEKKIPPSVVDRLEEIHRIIANRG
jgi:hypothetical protein